MALNESWTEWPIPAVAALGIGWQEINSSRPAWATYQVQGQSREHRKIPYQNKQAQREEKEEEDEEEEEREGGREERISPG